MNSTTKQKLNELREKLSSPHCRVNSFAKESFLELINILMYDKIEIISAPATIVKAKRGRPKGSNTKKK